MRDGAPKWRIFRRLFVDVNELVVLGTIGKAINAVLRDLNPFAWLKLGADGAQHFFLRYDFYCHGVFLNSYASAEAIKCSRAATFHRIWNHSQWNGSRQEV